MTKSTITREQITSWMNDASYALEEPLNADDAAAARAILAMGHELLAAMDSEPVGEFYEDGPLNWYQISDGDRVPAHRRIPLYRHAQPASERDQVRIAHAEWSQATFGNVGPVGPLKHLSKEALEAAEQPGDLSEWADMQFLLWDAQRRAGITDAQITQAMIEKLAVNKRRSWPEPKDGEPRLHIKEQPAPVVPDAYVRDERGRMMLNGVCEPKIGFGAGWNACRAAMLQGADGKPHLTVWYGSMPETNGKTNWTAILHRKGECLSTGITVCRSEYPDRVRYEADRMRHLIGDLADEPNILAYDADAHSGYVPPTAPQLPGSEPATVPGKWIPVSERIPIPGVDVLVAKEFFGPGDWRRKVGHVRHEESGWNIYGASWEPTHWMPLPAAPQEVK